MCVSSDPAGSLDKLVRIPRVYSLENELNAPEHLTGTPGIFNLTAFYFHFNTKVAFYPCDWVYDYFFSHVVLLLLGGGQLLERL